MNIMLKNHIIFKTKNVKEIIIKNIKSGIGASTFKGNKILKKHNINHKTYN